MVTKLKHEVAVMSGKAKRDLLILGIVLGVLCALAVAVGLVIKMRSGQPVQDAPAIAEKVVDNDEVFEEKGMRLLKKTVRHQGNRIYGQAVNIGSDRYSYVAVHFNLYDNDGARVGSAVDNVTALAPGDKWNFEAILLSDRAHTFKIVGFTVRH